MGGDTGDATRDNAGMSTTNGGDMPTTTDTYDALMEHAHALGADHGRSAASWYFDGNTPRETYEAVLRGIIEGDPATYDTFPASPLSGEWAGDPTPADVFSALEMCEDDDAADDALRMYEDGFGVAVSETIERMAREALAPHADAPPQDDDAPQARLEYLRGELRAERMSYGELAELQGLARFIEPGDVELLEAAGVPEFGDEARDDDDEPTPRDHAQAMARRFTRRTRTDGTTYTTLTDEADEWMRDLVRAAHGDMLPDDWRYDAIASAVEFIAENEDYDDRADEWADGMVDVYSSALLEWFGSRGASAAYVQEARDEWGDAGEDVWDEIRRGQFMEAREVFALVVSELEAD